MPTLEVVVEHVKPNNKSDFMSSAVDNIRIVFIEVDDSRFKLRSIRDIRLFKYLEVEKTLSSIVDTMTCNSIDYAYHFMPSDKAFPSTTSRRKLFKLVRVEIKSVMEPQNV